MINESEVKELATSLEVPISYVEKDYVMGWLLKGIYDHSFLSQNLVLKGGNCLRKVYFPETRFSDDLDFTISQYVNAENFSVHIDNICKEISNTVGIEFDLNSSVIKEKTTPDEECKAIDGRVYFKGFAGDSSVKFRVKFDLSDYEKVALPLQKHPLIHNFSDKEDCNAVIYSYSIEEVLAEKLRSWIQRTRSRDMYDIVTIIQSRIVPISYKNILSAFLKKTIYKTSLMLVNKTCFTMENLRRLK